MNIFLPGCNHMTCSKEACKYEFCWLCLTDWKLHDGGYYKCNKFESGQLTEPDKHQASRASLEKYLFYFNRFANHKESLKFEKDLNEDIKVYITVMVKPRPFKEFLGPHVKFFDLLLSNLVSII